MNRESSDISAEIDAASELEVMVLQFEYYSTE